LTIASLKLADKKTNSWSGGVLSQVKVPWTNRTLTSDENQKIFTHLILSHLMLSILLISNCHILILFWP